MDLRYVLLLLFTALYFSSSQVQGQRCRSVRQFQCFWDGACIPAEMKCDGKHDCVNGEDETQWFAECNRCSENQFHCHLETDFSHCIDNDLTCDGIEDCVNGEDETFKYAKCKDLCVRDLQKAVAVGRQNCRKQCKVNKDCRSKKCKHGEACDTKKCLCDYECGRSCVNTIKTCPMLKTFPHLRSIKYVLRNRKTNKVEPANEPFYYDVQAYHTCEPGYVALPTDVRMCHGRGDKPWTREIVCAKSCPGKNHAMVDNYKLSCGMKCNVDNDCEAGKICTCDIPCGRSCVNLQVECGDAPPVENTFIDYTGEKFDRVAHYICEEGFYIEEGGDTSRKCTGSGKYDGKPIKCAPVVCSEPKLSISKTGGRIVSEENPPYYFNSTVQLACKSGQRLLGSSERTCGGDGRWSGLLTVCDNTGSVERCPHPGVPVGGDLVGSGGDEDFKIGKWVKFRCNEGLAMVGEAEQECLYIKQWSGDGAPLCVDPRYGDSPSDVIKKLSANSANIRAVEFSKAGRTIQMNSRGKIEVYFVIDLSISVSPLALKNTINFAQSLVRRLSLNDTSDRVGYGIVVFATKAKLQLDIAELPKKEPKEVIRILREIELDIDNIRKKIKYGTNIHNGLILLDARMLSFSFDNDKDLIVKRHIFVITDGNFNAGGPPSLARKYIQKAYAKNEPEFYSITSSARAKDPDARQELKQIASSEANYVYVDDFYKLHQYIDQVTDVRIDYSPCGQAGDVGSVRKMVTGGRSIGGEDAVERAWPWQALITKFDQKLIYAYENVMGGGSLINDRWVLSAAHVFAPHNTGEGWETGFMVSLGILRRPHRINMLEGSVKIFQPEKIFTHEEYNIFEGKPAIGTLQNDVALIKLGGVFSVTANGQFISMPEVFPGMVDFTPYIRPVCLPCSPDSCVTEVLMKEDSKGQVLIKGDETPEEKCKIEYEFLMGKNEKDLVAVVATGFGHNASRKDDDQSWIVATQVMQQAVLKIERREQCKTAVALISRLKAIPGFEHIFTDEMFCAVGSSATKRGQTIVDTCKGDSGGPVVRQIRDETTKKSCFVQLGIVSWGYGCGQVTYIKGKRYLYPGFYTDVTSMMSWITRTMEDYEKSINAPKP